MRLTKPMCVKSIGPAMILAAAFLACATEEAGTGGAEQQAVMPKPGFTTGGELERPVGYREWVYVGTPLTPNDLNPPEAPFPEFHNVYIHPDDFAHWRATGTFRDGTILVKELVSVGSRQAVSGNGYFMGEFIGLEATVKNASRFPAEPGNWAYFTFGHVPAAQYAASAAAQPTANCAACHQANAANDLVFTQYYPVLTAASGGSATP